MQIGIVGLPHCGKSTLFQTITKTHLDTSELAMTEAHQAVIKVPDTRLDKLTEIFQPKKKTNAAIEFVDMIGLQKGDSGSAKFTGNFLSKVKTSDALIQVVRLFENELIPHPNGSINMMRDIETFETEFLISDLTIIEKRIENLKKQILKLNDDQLRRELSVLEKCYNYLHEEKPLRYVDLPKEEMQLLRSYQLLTIKPMLIALNLNESQISDRSFGKDVEGYMDILVKKKIGHNTKAVAFYGKIEIELSEFSDDEAEMFMKDYGISESALNRLIAEAYSLLGLQSFFTVGEDECRAWTIKKGVNAQEAAGEIHSDFYKKFIRAEVVHHDDFIKYGSFAKAKEQGAWRLEGKEYIVKDGDIIAIRHS
jgi:GTP-binding protein YchF